MLEAAGGMPSGAHRASSPGLGGEGRMSDRISASAGLQGMGLPAAMPGPADAARHRPLVQHGPAHGSLRKRKAAPDGEAASTPPRVSIDALRHPKRQALSGLAKDTGSAALVATQQALLDPHSPTTATATIGRHLWSHGSHTHKGGAKTLGSAAEPAAGKPALSTLGNLAFKQHATEPASGKTRHADTGSTYESDTAHSHSQAQVGAWARSVETAGAEALGHKGLGLSAAASARWAWARAARPNSSSRATWARPRCWAAPS